jgi:hypothetical protein
MAIQQVKTGRLTVVDGRTTTGRDFVKVPQLGTITILYIQISGGTASIDIEVSEDGEEFFVVQEGITTKSTHKVSWPCSVIATNVTAIAGATVTIRYRQIVYDSPPDIAIETFEGGDVRARRITIDGDVTVNTFSGTPTRIYGPAQPGTSNGTLYTVPAAKIAKVTNIHLANVTATAATVTLSINGSADANMLMKAQSVAANSVVNFPYNYALAAADTVQGLQGTSAAITVTISAELQDT